MSTNLELLTRKGKLPTPEATLDWESPGNGGPHSGSAALSSPVVPGLSDSSSSLESHSPGQDEDVQEGGSSRETVPGGANPPVEKTKEPA